MSQDHPGRDAEDPVVADLFARMPDRAARDELARRYLPLAEHLARRFGGRGQQHDDLVQVASLGLVNAIDRFDPSREVRFTTFATATIVGELKRYFRDRGWGVRVPRSVQEATMQVNRVMGSLWQELGRAPTVADIVARTDLTEESVLEALEASRAYTSASLDEPVGEAGTVAGDLIGGHDERFDVSEEWLAMAPKLRTLSERERRILYLRFFQDMTQTEIAEEIGISQMHVSRLLTQSLERLRDPA
ncbi:MAG: SigB/SigF/SigG family RNA polymerase sigma factor [Actinomycetota bacterium]